MSLIFCLLKKIFGGILTLIGVVLFYGLWFGTGEANLATKIFMSFGVSIFIYSGLLLIIPSDKKIYDVIVILLGISMVLFFAIGRTSL